MTTNTELIARLRSFETDHKPDGWPAIQMRDVSALLDAIEALEATNSANMATCKGIIQGLQAERDALQAQLAAAQGQRDQIADRLEAAYDDSKPLMELMKEAQAIVESKQVFKKFVRGTPLENDIAIWMAEFAKEKLLATPIPQQPAEPKLCKPCRDTGLLHCSDPENCGGPWTTPAPQPKE